MAAATEAGMDGGGFVSEPLVAESGGASRTVMAQGAPGLPLAFVWRGERYAVVRVMRAWKSNSPGTRQTYLRRHWYVFQTDQGVQMTVYFLRQGKGMQRWWLYSVEHEPHRDA